MADTERVTNLVYKRMQTLFDAAFEKKTAGQKLKEEANRDIWEGARLAAERNAAGDTQTFIAEQIGRDQSFVSRCIHIWKDYGENYATGSITESFWELMTVYQKTPAKDRKATVEQAQATGQSAATVANQKREQAKREARAGRLVIPKPTTQLGRILDCIVQAAEEERGLKSSEIADLLKDPKMPSQRVATRTADLEKNGWIVSDCSGPVTIWYLSEDGALQFSLDHGWKGKKKRATKRTTKPKDETPDQRRQRLEREALKAAEEEFEDRNSGASRFRGSLADWQRWIGGARFLHGLIDDEQYSCPPATQEVLLQTLDRFIEIATETVTALRSHQPTPVDMGYYKVLGVPTTATAAAIKKAYWELARKYHPDAQGGNDEKFKEIATANAVLSDPERRRLYNSDGKSMK